MDFKKYWIFFLLVFIYSWAFWGISIILGADLENTFSLILYYIGGIGPSLIGIILTYKYETRENIKEFWKRSFDPRLINLKGYIFIILFVVIPLFIGITFDILLGGHGATYEGYFELKASLIDFIPYILFLIVAVLAEEFGWRGYAQDNLQKEYSIFLSALIVGIFWSLWHFPLFFIKGTYQNSIGIGTFSFWLFFISIIPESVIYAWIFNFNNRSILSAILYHLFGNFMGEILNPVGVAPFIRFFTVICIAIILSYFYNKQKAQTK